MSSRPGKGSTFAFTLCFKPSNGKNFPGKQKNATIEQPATASLSLLLVKDNEASRILAGMVFKKLKHRVTDASDGLQALNLLAEHPFDSVIMDVQMPVMDGYTTSINIRAAECGDQIEGVAEELTCRLTSRLQGNHLPIIAMSCDLEKCLVSGMDDYLTKPFDPDQLNSILSKLIGQTPRLSEN